MIEQILNDANIKRALENLKDKHDSCGIDGVRLSELPDYIQNNLESIKSSIIDGTYVPGIVQEIQLINKKGKIRTIAKLPSIDRLLLRAIHQVLYDKFSPIFSPFSYAYQENKGVAYAVRQAADFMEAGYDYVVDIDFNDYFDNVPHFLLCEQLLKHGLDTTTTNLIHKFLNCRVVRDFEVTEKVKGLVQGSPLSPLLSNIYLHEADLFFSNHGYKFCRFADDIKVFAESFEDGLDIYTSIKQFVETELHLSLHPQKSGVFPALERECLGYKFYSFPNGTIEIKKHNRKTKTNIYSWSSTGIQKINDEYHLIADGIITHKDYNLLFENPEKKMYLPQESTECLNLYSNIIFSNDFFKFAAYNNLQLNFFERNGEYLGAFIPSKLSASSSLTMQQALVYTDNEKRLQLAKCFAMASAHNIRENIKYYIKRNGKEQLRNAVDEITTLIQKEKDATNVSSLMLIEARIRDTYYSCLNDILPYDDFLFTKRSRRPPEDPLNSLISFGNTVLYRRIAKEIYKSRLDIRIGFLHATNRRYESLNLDIAEIFRPVIVEKVIFSLINKHMLGEQLHFDYLDKGAVYLNSEGKKIFLTEFEEKMSQRLKTSNGGTISYSELIKAEISKLTRYFEKDEPYKPYKYFL